MSDQEFDAFLKKVPIDNDGMVKYVEFMSKFDTLWVLGIPVGSFFLTACPVAKNLGSLPLTPKKRLGYGSPVPGV